MIYGRWGQEVTIKRHARVEDVRKLDGREPDDDDFANLANGCYIVVEDGSATEGRVKAERLYALAFLRADDGAREITAEIDKLGEYPYAHETAQHLKAAHRATRRKAKS